MPKTYDKVSENPQTQATYEAFCAGWDARTEVVVEMLNNRICFDHRADGVCTHRECYGNLELIEKLQENNE